MIGTIIGIVILSAITAILAVLAFAPVILDEFDELKRRKHEK
jgi:hypothetical protein